MNISLEHLYKNTRALYVLNSCKHCRKWKEFIERLNFKIELGKRIEVIDCTMYDKFGVVTNPLIKVFEKYIKEYPTLIFDGVLISGTNSREEAEAYIRTALRNDFILPTEIKNIFNKDCHFEKKGFLIKRKVLVCQERG